MTDTDAGQKKKVSCFPSSEIITWVDLRHKVGCESNSSQREKNKQTEGTPKQLKTNKEATPELEDFVLNELEKLGQVCQSKHMQPSMSAIRVNLEKLVDRLHRGEPPVTDPRPHAS